MFALLIHTGESGREGMITYTTLTTADTFTRIYSTSVVRCLQSTAKMSRYKFCIHTVNLNAAHSRAESFFRHLFVLKE